MTTEFKDITPKSWKGDTVEAMCGKCGHLARIADVEHGEPGWCTECEVLADWKVLRCDCDMELMEGDDCWVCPGCDETYRV